VLIRYLPVFPAADGKLARHPDIYRLGGATGDRQGEAEALPAACRPA
jgi:hypothetical protein